MNTSSKGIGVNDIVHHLKLQAKKKVWILDLSCGDINLKLTSMLYEDLAQKKYLIQYKKTSFRKDS